MHLNRRTFLQTSLTAGLATAAEASGGHWLLEPSGPVRVGIVGLGGSAMEHLALYTAIPGSQIVAIADEDTKRLQAAARFLKEHGQPSPRLYRGRAKLCHSREIDVFSVPATAGNEAEHALAAVQSGRPVLFDVPAITGEDQTVKRLLHAIASSKSIVEYRLADLLYPNTPNDVICWVGRNQFGPIDARLNLTSANKPQGRSAAIASLDALLAAAASDLTSWDVAKQAQMCGVLRMFELPQEPFQKGQLRIHTLGGLFATKSTLQLRSRTGEMTIPISSQPDPDSSLQSFMTFLAHASGGGSTGNQNACRAHLAAKNIDQVLSSL